MIWRLWVDGVQDDYHFGLHKSGNGDADMRGVTCVCIQRCDFKDEAGKESVGDADKFYLPQL